jgi:thymidylate kinase
MVALSGIDGAGKSTQVEQALAWAAERGIRAETVWCRWDPLLAKPAIKLLVRLSGGGLSSHDSGPAASAAAGDSPPSRRRALKARLLSFPLVSAGWSAMMIVDYGLRVAPRVRRARRRNDLVILDRYWHDVIVDRSAGGKLRTPPRLLRWLLPDPDAVLVLDLPEAVALARQADVPDEVYLRDRRRLYLDLVRSGAAIAIDASRPADDVTQDVLDVLEHIEHDASPIAHGGPP